jgi:Macrocin-O-methyltransferase (TylF)
MSYLPDRKDFVGLARWHKGRDVLAGYQRGWGLEFGANSMHAEFHLADHIRADPIYRRAMEIGAGRSVMWEPRLMNLYLLVRFFLDELPAGDIIEFGSFRGGGVLFLASVLREIRSNRKVFSLDTFAGMPATNKQVDMHNAGDFAAVDLEELKIHATTNGLDNLVFVKGLFEETAPAVIRGRAFALAHIDCDIESAVRYSYDAIKPAMVKGGYIVFDDATTSSCIGATEAVEELVIRRDGLHSEQIWPHFVFRSP